MNSVDKQKYLLSQLKEKPFLLAPMAGITDVAFRSFMKRWGAGIVITELVSANGLRYDSAKTKKLMDFTEEQRPVGVQLFGDCPETMAAAAQMAEASGADFVDLNFGCPVNKVVKRGAGSALLRDLGQMALILRAVRSAISIPLTMKVRTGWDAASRNTHEVVKVASNEGVTWVAIHGRTRSQGYTGQADWSYIDEISRLSPLPVIGNGDIQTSQQAIARLSETGVAGVMIGRACLKNPWIFLQCQGLYGQNEVADDPGWVDLLLDLRQELERYFDERIVLIQMRKFAAWYSSGYGDSASFRKLLFTAKSVPELMEQVLLFFSHLANTKRMSATDEPFLMGGHG